MPRAVRLRRHPPIRGRFLGTLTIDLAQPGFYYSLGYTLAILAFGLRRIRRRNTPYVRLQTYSLMAFQFIPLFLLPYIVLPFMGHNGWFDSGVMKTVADNLFPVVNYDHGREYWRAFGFVLAWPLFIWNVFTSQTAVVVAGDSFAQTFVIIPLIIYRWGKGAYCGWVCSCARVGGNDGRYASGKDAAWTILEPPEYDRPGDFGLRRCLIAAFRFVSWMAPNSGLGRHERATVFWNAQSVVGAGR